jgi:energy-coupling factor transporter ATP-binding protein EcfA2
MDSEFQYDLSNVEFNEAFDFVAKHRGNLFLTGKAGTGKTTFLKYIKGIMGDEVVVTAPTGIAAVNAGGMTLHSLFQLPFGPLPPDDPRLEIDHAKPSQSPVLKAVRLRSKKRKIIKSMKILVIDEISMVRADVIDAVDVIMRAVTGKTEVPFGGKQLLMIGDNFQLPPVTRPEDDEILGKYYRSPFFFDSKVFYENPPAIIELKKIYRQQDEKFISLLNQVRHSTISKEALDELNERYIEGFEPDEEKNFILISTHNHTVDKINRNKLEALPGEPKEFDGEIDGDFDEKILPTKRVLDLKIGAQVMFIRNDYEKEKRYFNGTIGLVHDFDEDIIEVILETGEIIELTRAKWENVKYEWNEKEQRIDEEVIGEFMQFPLKPAWAITVHKSQGLTFDNVILDLHRCFAPGQTYVALSRCRSLEGTVLKSKIPRYAIKTAAEVIAFEQMLKEIM